MLEVGRLHALLAISEHGGPSGAARALGRPAGEVTGQLADWERELGLPLVDGDRLTRPGGGWPNTPGRLLGQLESAESDAAAVAGRVARARCGWASARGAGRVLLPDTLATLRSTELAAARAPAGRRAGRRARQHAGRGRRRRVRRGGAAPGRPGGRAAGAAHRAAAAGRAEPAPGHRRQHPAGRAGRRGVDRRGRRHADGAGAGGGRGRVRAPARRRGRRGRAGADAGRRRAGRRARCPASAAPSPAGGVRFLTVLDGGLRRPWSPRCAGPAAADPAVRRLLDALAGAARRVGGGGAGRERR